MPDPNATEEQPQEQPEEPRQQPIERLGLMEILYLPRLEQIYQDPNDYYWSNEWTAEFFVAQAKAGFISISYDTEIEGIGQVLLPQMHVANALLDWDDLHVSRSTRRWMRSAAFHEAGYELKVDYSLDDIIAGIDRCHGEENWLSGRYPDLLREVHAGEWPGFRLLPVALVDKAGALLAGELGCVTGKVYTSMSGFLDRSYEGFNHAGKLQLLRLGEHLRDNGFAFWNLGQPHMDYKFALGAKEVERALFLERWRAVAG